ncbi:recombinase family protein [uncultured Arthrobacter sp.]|uniref:recombinase family protein n=1 Tax=uncultured Arthrobacter sp. TaxID=114050 RepID=UPI0028D6C844|nr:recombinase family protein [uncultured Arthrobacter sp.]
MSPRGPKSCLVSRNVIGYARLSTRGQSLNVQVDALVEADAIKVVVEHPSGATQARARWQDCLEHLQPETFWWSPIRYRHGTRAAGHRLLVPG